MNEKDLLASENNPSTTSPSELPSGGKMLRLARESQGLNIESLAAVLKVPVSKLEALESGRIDLLPDVFFARALASSVCRSLKIDSEEILAQFPSISLSPMKTDESGINTPFRVPGEGIGLGGMRILTKPFALAIFFLLAGALALFLLPSLSLPDLFGPQKGGGEVVSVPVPVQPVTSAVLTDETLPDVSASSSQPATAGAGLGADESPPVISDRVDVSPLPVIVSGNGAVSGVVVFKARGSTWVEVVDAAGSIQLRKTLAEGDTVGISGALPLAVVIGRADLIAVEVRGKVMDLAPFSKNNIARFEVK